MCVPAGLEQLQGWAGTGQELLGPVGSRGCSACLEGAARREDSVIGCAGYLENDESSACEM